MVNMAGGGGSRDAHRSAAHGHLLEAADGLEGDIACSRALEQRIACVQGGSKPQQASAATNFTSPTLPVDAKAGCVGS